MANLNVSTKNAICCFEVDKNLYHTKITALPFCALSLLRRNKPETVLKYDYPSYEICSKSDF